MLLVPDTDGQKIALFEYISQNYRVLGITWKTIADALEGVGYGDLALSIRERYCQSQQGESVHSDLYNLVSPELLVYKYHRICFCA